MRAFFLKLMGSGKKSTARDMTSGSIIKEIVFFAVPLMMGNIFQMLYNTVDSIVVGNFVGTSALAAVGSATPITGMAVFFFSGFSVGASVVIGRYYGAGQLERLHRAVETTMAATFIISAIITVIGVLSTNSLLRMIATPADVFGEASLYVTVYFAGISGLLVYNMGSSILRAVGDTTRPLYFLILTSVLNIILDLLFVVVFGMGILGVALATIIAQFISALLVMLLLTWTEDIYRFAWRDLAIDGGILQQIFSVGLPAGIQSVITAFSNTFVQGYINTFGSTVMAGWGCYNKLDQFIMLPMQSMAMAATTFVSQNIGARKMDRVDRGTFTAISVSMSVTAVIAAVLVGFAEIFIAMFSKDPLVVRSGALFLRANTWFLLFNCVNHVLAGALRGRGDARGPMVIMLLSFVAIRQIYLYILVNFVANDPVLVGFGYPVGWTACCIIELSYFFIRWRKKPAEQV